MTSSPFWRALATTLFIVRCTTALITPLITPFCIWSTTTPLSRTSSTTYRIANSTVDRNFPCSPSTAHISIATITVFSASSATSESFYYSDTMSAFSIIFLLLLIGSNGHYPCLPYWRPVSCRYTSQLVLSLPHLLFGWNMFLPTCLDNFRHILVLQKSYFHYYQASTLEATDSALLLRIWVHSRNQFVQLSALGFLRASNVPSDFLQT